MRKLTLLLTTLLFSLTMMFSFPSFAKWTKVSKSAGGDTFYVDFERVKKVDGYIYFWRLRDYPKPDVDGDLSGKIYTQGDCKLFRDKLLSGSFHTKPMGKGTPSTTGNFKNPEWNYPPPNSSRETILKKVCWIAN